MTLGLALVVAAYLLGSVPFGVIIGKALAGVDVRHVGSGNIGATNVGRAAGPAAGIATLVLDAMKGVLPVLAARAFLEPAGVGGAAWPAAAGVAAFLGHLFPPWLRFHGGKGVATALGVVLALSPWVALAAAAAFAAVIGVTRIVSAASLAGAATCAVGMLLLHGARNPATWAAFFMAAAIAVRHRGNIGRLARGEERRVGR
ncbi:MAG TPA: glycerol-3-phosphate 1-O-acyltransferase PlsY [Anaeromyxobacteraceae bacterium]|nr:glycerol-3-phosphate 1-O-acyltransferase PlsY [Anaeromyxobacteraceae bacterium]